MDIGPVRTLFKVMPPIKVATYALSLLFGGSLLGFIVTAILGHSFWPKLMLTLALFALVLIPFTIWFGYLMLPRLIYFIKTEVRVRAPSNIMVLLDGRYHLFARISSFVMEKGKEARLNEHIIDMKLRKADCDNVLQYFLTVVEQRIYQERQALIDAWRNANSTAVIGPTRQPPKLRIDRSYRRDLAHGVKHPERED